MADHQELINRYRPDEFDHVIGHEEVLRALKRVVQQDSHAHGYLLTGPSGVGKTTIARIICKWFEADLVEVDAATYSGVTEMRELLQAAGHRAFNSKNGRRMYLMNEVQRLSKNAFDALLTTLEEPPEHLYFALTTTEPDKIPRAVETRCYPVRLNRLAVAEIETLLALVAEAEEWAVEPDVIDIVTTAAEGSARQALTLLQAVYDAESREEVQRRINLHTTGTPVIELCQALLRGRGIGWDNIQRLLQRIDNDNWEEAVIAAGRYLAAAMQRAKDAKEAQRAWRLLEALVFPSSTFDRKAAFYAAVGRMLWADGVV